MENQTKRKVKRLRIDDGLEYYSSEFNDFYIKRGISRYRMVKHTPQ